MTKPGDMVTDGHLGGYIAGGDPDTTYPQLWAWLVASQGVRTVIDVGCGDGIAVQFFESLGCHVLGVDGMPQTHPSIVQHDYTMGPLETRSRQRSDLAWSCEFVEHVEEQYVPNFLDTFRLADLVLITHAEPGQRGWHHVNCQPAAYWLDKLASIDYEWDRETTLVARARAAENRSPWNHFARSGLAFRPAG